MARRGFNASRGWARAEASTRGVHLALCVRVLHGVILDCLALVELLHRQKFVGDPVLHEVDSAVLPLAEHADDVEVDQPDRRLVPA